VGLGFIYLSFILFFEKTRIDEFSFGLACVLVSTAISLIWTNQNIRYFQSWLKHNYANPNCIKLGWLRVIFFVTAAIWMLRFFDALTGPGVPLWHFRPMLRAIGLCWVAYYLIKYSLVFQEVRGLQEERKEKSPPVSPEDLVRLSDKLKQLFEKEKPYLDPEFRLSDLAKLLSLKPYQASYFLNQSLQESFYDLVNRARIEEVKRRLKDPKYQHLNILGVGFDCGFNSKSSFVEAFKKWTHQTPSEYRRSNV
jgi:AraC-like DNA-binding protein